MKGKEKEQKRKDKQQNRKKRKESLAPQVPRNGPRIMSKLWEADTSGEAFTPLSIRMLFLSSSFELRSMTFHTPLSQNATFWLKLRAPKIAEIYSGARITDIYNTVLWVYTTYAGKYYEWADWENRCHFLSTCMGGIKIYYEWCG